MISATSRMCRPRWNPITRPQRRSPREPYVASVLAIAAPVPVDAPSTTALPITRFSFVSSIPSALPSLTTHPPASTSSPPSLRLPSHYPTNIHLPHTPTLPPPSRRNSADTARLASPPPSSAPPPSAPAAAHSPTSAALAAVAAACP